MCAERPVMGEDGTVLAGTEIHYLRSDHVGDEF